MYLSKFGLKIVGLFLFFSLLGRFLFPFGDEPDIMVRGPEILDDASFWNLYHYFPSFIQYINFDDFYFEKQNFTLLWHQVKETPEKFFDFNLLRYAVTIAIFSPILWALIFRKKFIRMMSSLKFKLSEEEWNTRLDSLGLSIIYSGIIYYSGLFSVEQFTLVLSLFLFLFWGNYLLVALFFLMITSIDLGNSMVLLTFIIITIFFQFSVRKEKNMKVILISMVVLISIALTVGINFLTLVENIPFLAEKSRNMLELEKFGSYREKYPVVLRPFITLMTSIFLTPAGIKVVFLYVLFLLGIAKLIQKIVRTKLTEESGRKKIFLLSATTTILFFVFLFPNYANAKYYIFMLPFFMMSVLQYYSKKQLLAFFTVCNLILFLHLFLYQL